MVSCDEGKNIAPIAACTIGPQTRLLALENDLKTIAGAAQYVTDMKRPSLYLAGWEEREQHRFQASDERRLDCFALAVAIGWAWCNIRVEVQWIHSCLFSHRIVCIWKGVHGLVFQQRSDHEQNLHSK